MIAETFIKRPVTAIVISIVIVLVGIIAMSILPIAQYPDITPPSVSVSANFIGADAQTVEQTTTTPIETQINGTPGMTYLSSTSSSSGSSGVSVNFDIGTNIDIAALDVQNRVSVAQPSLPDAVKRLGITVRKRVPSIMVALALYSPNGTHDATFIGNYANIYLKEALQRVKGVGDIVSRADDFGMRIWLNPEKLAALGMTPADIIASLSEQNLQVAAGTIGGNPQPSVQSFEYSVLTNSRVNRKEQFESIVVRTIPSTGTIVYLKDVARVELGKFDYGSNAYVDGKPAAFVLIYQAPGANALETYEGITQALVRIKKTSADKLVITGSISQNNVLGPGNSLALQVNTSRTSKTAVISYTNPYFTPDGISRGIDIYRRTYDPTTTGVGSYKLSTFGTGMRFGVPISETDSISFGGSAENSNLTLYPGISPQRFFDYANEFGYNNNTYKVTSGWARDSRDSLIYPTRGWLQSIGVESTIPVTNIKFFKINYQGQAFIPLVSDFVYGLNVELGYANGYGKRSLPFFQNYYGGGVGSVRGYETNSLGPREAVTSAITTNPDGTTSSTTSYSGNATGGKRKFTINNEILFPFPGTKNDKSVRGSFFFDAGQIYDKGEPLQKDNERIHMSTGIAIAWQSPIGALKFSYAIPIGSKPGDKLQRFQFQVGTLF